MKIYVAGHKGLVGSALVRRIEKDGLHSWVGQSRDELDLMNYDDVLRFLSKEKPDAMIVAAAKVGGIGANAKFPVEFLNENLRIELNLLEAAHVVGLPRVLFLGSSCIYPKFAEQPIKESQLLSGYLEATNEPYAIAKIAGLKMIEAYATEYGHDWISAMPTNIYGPNDNFNADSGHVLPSLIGKFHKAKIQGDAEVDLWGTGQPRREFLHSDDLASGCLFLLENYHSPSHTNVGTGEDISIFDLANLVRNIVGYEGSVVWNTDMPDGTPRKLLDVSKINDLGWTATVPLVEGIKSTYKWFLEAPNVKS